MAMTQANAVAGPSGLSALSDWIPASVPGTAAGALAEAGRFSVEAPTPLHDKDVWYVVDIRVEEPAERLLVMEGLATIAEVYWNGEKMLDSDSMFLRYEVPVSAKADNSLAICFRALAPHLEKKGPRARWRPQLAVSQGLRLVRTTLLGHMPGWCPEVHAVGPWRPISLVAPDECALTVEKMSSVLDEDGTGVLSVAFGLKGSAGIPTLHCGA